MLDGTKPTGFPPFTNLKSLESDLSALTEELKQLNQNPSEHWYAIGSRLEKIHNEGLYRTGGYSTFSDYCKRGVGYSRQHIYKLIKLVQFIDQLLAEAVTPEEEARVKRLFNFGFTKLYVLHLLPPNTLDYLLKNGVTLPGNDLYPECTIELERVTIEQLKRFLKKEPTNHRRQSSKSIHLVSSLINAQISSLSQIIERCQHHLNDPEALADQLKIAQKYTTNIQQTINSLLGNEVEPPDHP